MIGHHRPLWASKGVLSKGVEEGDLLSCSFVRAGYLRAELRPKEEGGWRTEGQGGSIDDGPVWLAVEGLPSV